MNINLILQDQIYTGGDGIQILFVHSSFIQDGVFGLHTYSLKNSDALRKVNMLLEFVCWCIYRRA